MPREEWMLPRKEMIGRSLDPHASGSRRPLSSRVGDARRASVLLACVAVVAILLSGAVALLMGGSQGPSTPGLDVPETAAAPPTPFIVAGHTYDGMDNPLPFCTVTITDTNTGEYIEVECDAEGYYSVDLNLGLPSGCADGDVIHVVAVEDTLQLMGENEGTVVLDDYYLVLDITLDVVIPEFSMLIVPVAGIMVMFVAVGVRRRNRQ